MRIKVITLVGAVLACSSVYLLKHTADTAYRNMGFETQVEPTFYQRQIVDDLSKKEVIELPNGVYGYTYQHSEDTLIRTVWTFTEDKLQVDGYLVNNFYSSIDNKEPNYTAKSKVSMKGQVLIFHEIDGDIGLLPKYGMAINSYTIEGIKLETSDGSDQVLYKLGQRQPFNNEITFKVAS